MMAAVRKNIDEPFMSVERSGKPLCVFLLLINILNTVFLPYDTFHLKAASLTMLLLVGVRCWFVAEAERTILVYSLAVTSLTIVLSILQTGDIAGNIKGGYMGMILLLLPIIKYYRINFEKMLMNTIILMSYCLIVLALLDYLDILRISKNPLLLWYFNTGNGKFAHYDSSVTSYRLYLKTSPMICLAMPYCLKKKRFISFVGVFVAMFISGTRANQIVGLLSVGCSLALIRDKSVTKTIRCLIMLVIMSVFLAEGSLIEYFKEYFTDKAWSDDVREATKSVILQGWKENPLNFFIGTGYTSAIFDPTRKEMMPIVENSYWNLLRQIGLLPFIMMMGMYLYPIVKLVLEKREWAYASVYVGYLAICYNDPLLYSTTGMMVLLYMYYLCFSPLAKVPQTDFPDSGKHIETGGSVSV